TEERYFVTPHAVERYRQRVDRRATYEQAVAAIERGIRDVAPMYPPNRPIAIGDKRKRFVAIVAPPRTEHGPWPSVMTVWGWGICPILLKRKRCRDGDRHYRWLSGPAPARRD
ncbi:MAG TPA: hypothetical protein VF178_08475, partial [Gemmatimonadaceae bacterium]